MKWSYHIATVAGIQVRIHTTFFLLLLFYAWMGYSDGGTSEALLGITFISALFFCVLLHEFGHAFAARYFGIRTPDITLLPFGGVARLERMPRRPYQELVVALAGPLVNVVIAIGIAFFLGSFGTWSDFLNLERVGGDLLAKLAVVNIALVVFNMIPAFPMDGGRVLRSLLAMKFPHAKATWIAARVGQGIAILFGLWAIIQPGGNFILIFIALFVFMGAQQELMAARFEASIPKDALVQNAMITQFMTLPASLSFGEAREMILQYPQPSFPVLAPDGALLGMLEREQIEGAGLARANQNIASMVEPGPFLSPMDPLSATIEKMQNNGKMILPVVDATHRVCGILSLVKF
ncbi:MAG: site-2 protease family protein [Chthoniobacterales bacterium]